MTSDASIAGEAAGLVWRAHLDRTIRELREELCTRKGRCSCGPEPGYADSASTPCCRHQAVNVQLDILDELAARLGIAPVTAANEPELPRDRDGKRGMFTGWPPAS